jgi:hypothetical protein
MKTTIFAKCIAVVLAAGLTSFAGNAEAAIVSLDAPLDVGGHFEVLRHNQGRKRHVFGTDGNRERERLLPRAMQTLA